MGFVCASARIDMEYQTRDGWIKGDKDIASCYIFPRDIGIPTNKELEYAKQQRKGVGQLREEILGLQKVCGQMREIEIAKFLRESASDLMKQYRGWDMAIKWSEGDAWDVSEDIGPFVHCAFYAMSYMQP